MFDLPPEGDFSENNHSVSQNTAPNKAINKSSRRKLIGKK